MAGLSGTSVAYVVRSWPRLSQTFVLNEVLELERLGCELSIFAMTRSGEEVVQPRVAEVRAPVQYLDEPGPAVSGRWPRRYAGAWATAVSRPRLGAGYATTSPRACLGMAARVATAVRRAREEGRAIHHVHAHFAHDPALVAMFAHRLTGLSYSFTAHARDLYGIPRSALVARARPASAVVTCCQANADYLDATLPGAARRRVHLIHHGVDLEAFAPAGKPAGGTADGLPLILSVGRLVEKKGFGDLLLALARLHDAGHRFRAVVYGDGPLRADLEADRRRLGLDGVVTFAGECRQDEVIAAMRRADVFALTPCIAADGDRDGVPNVLAEAMACGLPTVTTAVGGIEDAIRHGQNGLLAAPHDVDAIAQRIGSLLASPEQRELLGTAARRAMEERFDLRRAAMRLNDLFASMGRR